MKKLSLLLAGAMMMPAIANADNMAVNVEHSGKSAQGQRIEISDAMLPSGQSSSFTMSTWVKVSNYNIAYTGNDCGDTNSKMSAMIMGHRARVHENLNASFWVGYSDEGKLHLSGKYPDTSGRFTTDQVIPLDEWTYLTLTFDYETKTWTLYMNAEEVKSSTSSSFGSWFGDTDLKDANFNGCVLALGSTNFNGAIDEFQFWPSALTAEQVADAMKDATNVEGITGLYTFDEVNDQNFFTNEITDGEKSGLVSAFFNRTYTGSVNSGTGPISATSAGEPQTPSFVEGRVIAQDYCTDFSDAGSNACSRHTTGLKVSNDRGAEFALGELQSATNTNIFFDKTDVVMKFPAGTTITVQPEGEYQWMHNYFYIDLNKDGVFSVDNMSDKFEPLDGCELISHTGIGVDDNHWYASTGQTVLEYLASVGINHSNANYGQYNTKMPAYTIPADLKPGVYRARYRCAWSVYDPCSPYSEIKSETDKATLGASNQGGIVVDFLIEVTKDAHQMRTISIKSSDETLGTVEFVGVEVEGNEITTTDNVTVKAVAADEAAYLVNWTDAEGNEVSTETEFIYTGEEAIELTANFRQHYAVEFDSSVKVSNSLGEITSGTIVDKGTELTVKPVIANGMVLAALKVNDVDVTDKMVDNVYTFEVESATTIAATFEAMKGTINLTVEGDGKVVLASENAEGVPGGTTYAQGDLAPYGSSVFVFLYPNEGAEVLSAVCDDYDYAEGGDLDPLTDGGYVFETNVFSEDHKIAVKFSGKTDAIEAIEAAAESAEYFNLQGVRVDVKNLTPGIYVRRAADKAEKVIVK